MLDINYIRSQKERVIEGMKQKGESDVSVVDQVLEVDTRWRQMVTRLDRLRSESNQKAKQIGKLMGEGRQEEAREIIEETSSAKQSIKEAEEELTRISSQRRDLLLRIPNVPHPSVPVGSTEDDNVVHDTHGEPEAQDRKSTRLNSSHVAISYAVFCLKKK